MFTYEQRVRLELEEWKRKMTKKPSIVNQLTKGIQGKINQWMPEQVQSFITKSIKHMVQGVLIGSEYITKEPLLLDVSLEGRERRVIERLDFYKKLAAAEGAGTGAGGILLGLADFPLLLGIKMKFLFDTAVIYGFDISKYTERLYILYLFQLAFSNDQRRREIYYLIRTWEETIQLLPRHYDEMDWKTFQQEYRDYLDIAKLLQLVPGIGAVIGAYVNYQLLDTLGETAMNGYRLRILN
ncbi:EcsC family protein [Tepidibacillus fermentans]|uniref:EcsC family protein n=1 Tax=Tepidibacillus fermentans TaxID=1281767 RepID=A0A4R3KD56_9BACI|nr:EcsC family protein [Tepidibacillus fermentans]TCS81068.1 EcsC family protein [Tepidibacillus fermentans]